MNSDEIPDESQLHNFLDWLEDPVAEAAYADCENTWQVAGQLQKDDVKIPTQKQTLSKRLLNPGALLQQLGSRAGLTAQAAGLALVAVAAVWFSDLISHNDVQIYQTATGQQTSHTLSDGSLVTLNTASEIHVSYSDDARKITLARGEVLFDVAKDKHRPFSVSAGNGKITALGTIFNVRKSANHDSVDVMLLEGKLQVTASVSVGDDHSQELTKIINANDALSYSRQRISERRAILDSQKVTEWKHGRVSFTDTKLSDILAEVNRYCVDKLFIEEQSLAQERLDAYFVIGDTEALLLALEETLNVTTTERSDGIFLARNPVAQ